jgi:rRNA maturation endonuclease Nob1
MATKMIRINLSELKTWRIACAACKKYVIEVRVENLDTALNQKGECRFCGHRVMANMSPNPLTQLQEAIDALSRLEALEAIIVEVEIPSLD